MTFIHDQVEWSQGVSRAVLTSVEPGVVNEVAKCSTRTSESASFDKAKKISHSPLVAVLLRWGAKARARPRCANDTD